MTAGIACCWTMDGMPTSASKAFPNRWSANTFGLRSFHWTKNWRRRFFIKRPASPVAFVGRFSIPAPIEGSIARPVRPKSIGGKRPKVNGGAELPAWTIRRLEPVANQGLQTRAQQGADTFPFAAQNYDFRRKTTLRPKQNKKGFISRFLIRNGN